MSKNVAGLEIFLDVGRAEQVRRRLFGDEGGAVWESLVADLSRAADPDRALANLERWLRAPGSFETRLQALVQSPGLSHRLIFLLGASQMLSDSLIQNPELALMLDDAEALRAHLDAEALMREGRDLLRSSVSFSHSLDRLRFLKQKTLAAIVWNDLSGSWAPEDVWTALSTLADVVIVLADEIVRSSSTTGVRFAVMGLGKHGSCELNYSSDIDLLFIAGNDANVEAVTKHCEKLTRALTGKMGRGSLYRIDLRLRPLGNAGPLVQKLSAAAKYYQNYAEPWEMLALVRCRQCAGDADVGSAFLSDVRMEVYRGARSELFLESLLESKKRYEVEVAARGEGEANVKLGRGGIRDVEFMVQLRQLLRGREDARLQDSATCEAIGLLRQSGAFTERSAETLSNAYRLLRQVEHRIQLLHGLQSHILPKGAAERLVIARLMGFQGWQACAGAIGKARSEVRLLLETEIPALAQPGPALGAIGELIGAAEESIPAQAAHRLVQHSDDEGGFLREVAQSPETRARLQLIATHAPRLIPEVAFHRELWDVAFSDEVELVPEHETDIQQRMGDRIRADPARWEGALAAALRREAVVAGLKEAYHRDVTRTFGTLTKMADCALLAVLDRLGGDFIDIIAVGRLGSEDPLLASDWDVMLLIEDQGNHAKAEHIGEESLRTARRLALASAHFPIDPRLRPEGSSGLVVRSIAGFSQYAETAMEPWERVMLTRARSLRMKPASIEAVRAATLGRPWLSREEAEIHSMRARVHSERLRPWEAAHDLKLSPGFLLDIEWLAAIAKLRLKLEAPSETNTVALLKQLEHLGRLPGALGSQLADAFLFYSRMRNVLFLLDMESDTLVPENPEKLGRIAASLGLAGANAVLQALEEKRVCVLDGWRDVVGGPPA